MCFFSCEQKIKKSGEFFPNYRRFSQTLKILFALKKHILYIPRFRLKQCIFSQIEAVYIIISLKIIYKVLKVKFEKVDGFEVGCIPVLSDRGYFDSGYSWSWEDEGEIPPLFWFRFAKWNSVIDMILWDFFKSITSTFHNKFWYFKIFCSQIQLIFFYMLKSRE